LHADGYGFVIPDGKGGKDVFIPAPFIAGAMNGDRVEASVLSRPTKKKSEGRILAIVERSQTQLVGR